MSLPPPQAQAVHLRCRAAHFIDSPGRAAPRLQGACLDYLADAILSFSGGKFLSLLPTAEALRLGLDLQIVEDLRPSLVVPGFIDGHVHAPQLNIIGAYGHQLLDWLEHYTFPEEQRFAEAQYARTQTEQFIQALLANGVTSACVFTSSHRHSAMYLFECALAINMRVIAGKVNMDCNAPPALLDGENGITDCIQLIDTYHHRERLGYALTPRFACTSTAAQMRALGALLERDPSLWIQTHLSENLDEVRWIRKLFPAAKHYLDVYDRVGLVTERSVFAHGIHLGVDEHLRLAESGACIAFCPSSNLFLGSGLLNLQQLRERGVNYLLASDVGAGTSLSPFRTMADAYKVAQLQGYSLSAQEAWFRCTLGAARALGLDHKIGSLEAGKEADFLVLNAERHPALQQRLQHSNTIDEELFVYMTLGDERLIARSYVYGAAQYLGEATSPRT